MKKQEWQQFHGFDDEDMEKICLVKEIFNGTVVSIKETRPGSSRFIQDKQNINNKEDA